jgi:hypothetical protein
LKKCPTVKKAYESARLLVGWMKAGVWSPQKHFREFSPPRRTQIHTDRGRLNSIIECLRVLSWEIPLFFLWANGFPSNAVVPLRNPLFSISSIDGLTSYDSLLLVWKCISSTINNWIPFNFLYCLSRTLDRNNGSWKVQFNRNHFSIQELRTGGFRWRMHLIGNFSSLRIKTNFGKTDCEITRLKYCVESPFDIIANWKKSVKCEMWNVKTLQLGQKLDRESRQDFSPQIMVEWEQSDCRRV